MSIFRIKKHSNPYVILDKTCLEDESLSWRAKGIHAYLISKPDDWQVRMSQLIASGREGREAVRSALKELTKAGYISREAIREADGTLRGQEWSVYESPIGRKAKNPSDGDAPPTKEGAKQRSKEETESLPCPSLSTSPQVPPNSQSCETPQPVQKCTPAQNAAEGPRSPAAVAATHDKPPAPAERHPRKPVKRRTTWMTPFDDLYFTRTGGHLPFARYAKPLKRFVDDHGLDLALAWFKSWVERAPVDEFHTLDAMLRNPMPWKPKTNDGKIAATEKF